MFDWITRVIAEGVLQTIRTTLVMSLFSTFISSFLGIIIGLSLERYQFLGKSIIIRINRTMMGVPPVVIGLVVYLLLMRQGPLGFLSALFTIQGMIFAQVLIITPIISSMIHSYSVRTAAEIRVFARTMGANKRQTAFLVLREMRHEIYFVMLTGFGRAISEVGAVMLVGGNIRGSTRTMTTAITMLRNQGIFYEGILLGVTLLVLAFILQSVVDGIRKKDEVFENY